MGRRRSNAIVRALVILKDQAGNTFSRILGGRRRASKPKVMKRRRLGRRLATTNKLRLLKRSLKQKSRGVQGRALNVKKKMAKLVSTKQQHKHKRKQSRQHRRRIQNAKKLKLKSSSKGLKKKNSRRGRRKKKKVAGKKKN